jgi:hypothetical protein
MIKGFLNVPYFAWTVLALFIAGIFVYVWPHKAVTVTTGFRYFVIRWGHALPWVLLALNFSRSVRGIGPELNRGASFLALAGGLIYLMFIVTVFIIK